MKRNKHEGSSFDDFLKDEGIYEDVEATAIKKVIAVMLAEAMKSQKISKVAMVKRIGTSRSQLDRLLDPDNARDAYEGGRRNREALENSV